jgi:hypothetical protein
MPEQKVIALCIFKLIMLVGPPIRRFKQLAASGVPVFKGVPGSTHAQPKSQTEERKNLPVLIFHPFSIRR